MTIKVPFEANSIAIIDSIPAGESQTARRLYDHIKDVQYDPATMQCDVTHHVIANANDLSALLSKLADEAETAKRWPLIHIESHGNNDGLGLANGDFVRWEDLQPAFMRLNKGARNHLFVVVAACWGFYGIKTMIDKTDHGASLRMLAGPVEVTFSGPIEDAMKGFYRSLLTAGNIAAAVEAAQQSEPTFRIYSAEEAFVAGWKIVVRNYPKTNSAVQKKAEEIVTQLKASPGSEHPSHIHSRAKAAVRSLDLQVPFDEYKRTFFMLDAFPEVGTEIEGLVLPEASCAPSLQRCPE